MVCKAMKHKDTERSNRLARLTQREYVNKYQILEDKDDPSAAESIGTKSAMLQEKKKEDTEHAHHPDAASETVLDISMHLHVSQDSCKISDESNEDAALKEEHELINDSQNKIVEILLCAENDSCKNIVTLHIEAEKNLQDAHEERMNLI